MKYRYSLLAIVLALVISSPIVYADNVTSASSKQLQLLSQNCVRAQSAMTRLHANDALARVHLGQEYETILSNLMTPMNSRVVLNKYDGSDMIKTTATFSTKLDSFRSLYQQYDETMTKLIQMDCSKKPSSFLDNLTAARSYRQSVRSTVVELGSLVQRYRAEVSSLQVQVKAMQPTEEDS